jgi:hypothetical protein
VVQLVLLLHDKRAKVYKMFVVSRFLENVFSLNPFFAFIVTFSKKSKGSVDG